MRIAIGVDGSTGAFDTVRVVARRPWPPQTEARLVVVDDPLLPTTIGRFLPPITRWVEEGNKQERAWAEEILQGASAILKNTELVTSTRVVEGDPKRGAHRGGTGMGSRYDLCWLYRFSATDFNDS
ncbi:MAG: hypothetical protein WKF84_19580 [Pyrinomonadaceae bacterium]